MEGGGGGGGGGGVVGGGGVWGVFVGVVEYIGHILIGHEIKFKNF